jgi:hypothetical protein
MLKTMPLTERNHSENQRVKDQNHTAATAITTTATTPTTNNDEIRHIMTTRVK